MFTLNYISINSIHRKEYIFTYIYGKMLTTITLTRLFCNRSNASGAYGAIYNHQNDVLNVK